MATVVDFTSYRKEWLTEVRDGDQALRQCADTCVAVVTGKVPGVRVSDLRDVSPGGIGDGILVRGLLLGVWDYSRDGQMGFLHLPGGGAHRDGPAGAITSGSGHVAGVRGGAVFFRVCATG